MSDANLERDPELESMISGERIIPSPTQGQRERVWRKLELVLPTDEPVTHPETPAGTVAKGIAAKVMLSGVSAVVGGVIAIATERQLIDHTVERPRTRATEVRAPEASRTPPAPAPSIAAPTTIEATTPTPQATSRRRAEAVGAEENAVVTETETGLREEQSWIATMRAGLVRREFDEVARRAREYHARFPAGQLAEDCDALALLAGLNSDPQTTTAADVERFLGRYPTSLYRAAIVRAQRPE